MRRYVLASILFLFAACAIAQVVMLQRRPSVVAAPSFEPDDVANMLYWFKPETINSNVGETVGYWPDSGPNGYHVRQANNNYRPILTNNLNIGGSNFLYYQQANCALTTPCPSNAQPITFFILAVPYATNLGMYLIDATNTAAGAVCRPGIVSPAYHYMASSATLRGANGSVAINEWLLFEHTFNGANSTIITNGVQLTNGNAGTYGQDGITIGNRANVNNPWNGGIAEIIAYGADVSSVNRSSIRTYFSNKYGL